VGGKLKIRCGDSQNVLARCAEPRLRDSVEAAERQSRPADLAPFRGSWPNGRPSSATGESAARSGSTTERSAPASTAGGEFIRSLTS
jgi:hypothetical protein